MARHEESMEDLWRALNRAVVVLNRRRLTPEEWNAVVRELRSAVSVAIQAREEAVNEQADESSRPDFT